MKTLNERRDELAEKHCGSSYDGGDKEYTARRNCRLSGFKDGFDAAVNELRPEIDALVKALEEILPLAGRGVPEPGRFGSCTPESMCDMTCSDAFHSANLICDTKNALTRFKEFMGEK